MYDRTTVKIRAKMMLVFLPLLLTPLILTAAAASFAARNGITGVATSFLRFKAEQLESYVRGQWDLLVSNRLQGNARLVDAVRSGVAAFAASLVRSQTELILAVDGSGRVAMSTAPVNLSETESAELALIAETGARGWRLVRLGGKARVAQTFTFEPFSWLVVVSEQRETFYSAVGQIYWQSAAITGVFVAATLVLMFLFSRYLTRPLRNVVGVMRDVIARGDLSRRVDILYEDETGELAHTFNLMTGQLESAYGEIKGYAWRAAIAERKERKIRNIFQKYVPNDVIEQFFASPESLLTGETRVVAILFSDVRGFTSISETLKADELVDSLNHYFGAMVDIVMRHGGLVDKYIGDAVMAVYGATVKHKDDARQAVESAFEMLQALGDFNAWMRQRRASRVPHRRGDQLRRRDGRQHRFGQEARLHDHRRLGQRGQPPARGSPRRTGSPSSSPKASTATSSKEFPCRMIDRVAVKGRAGTTQIYSPRRSLTPAGGAGVGDLPCRACRPTTTASSTRPPGASRRCSACSPRTGPRRSFSSARAASC